jgi:hypothetical protein
MRRMHKLIVPLLILGAIFMAGLVLTSPSQAQTGLDWLPFGGSKEPAEPKLALLRASTTAIDLQANLPGAYVEAVTAGGTTYTRLSGTGYGYPVTYGLPELPVLRQEVEIPFGAQVSVELVSSQYTDSSLSKLGLDPIYPLQPPVIKLEELENDQPFTIDQQYYASGSQYPDRVISLGEPYVMRGHRILPVEVWPVAYDPSQASLRLYSVVTFRLNISGSDMATTNRLADRYASPAFDPYRSERVLNYNQGRPLAVNEQVGYLIISADAYVGALAPLVALRENRGFEVTLTPASAIPGGISTATIKAYIQTAYDTWQVPPSYVLLVGDTNSIPTWTGPTIGTSTDLYYATMDGPSDWHPDIGRGRFPVRSVAQTTYMVDKLLFYAGLTGQEPWLKTASFPATCDNYTVAEGTHNYVINSYTAPGGWTGTFPGNPQPGGDKLYCVTNHATHQNLIDQFSMGRWAIIYSGHGSYNGWEMSFVPQNIRDLPANSMYPFVASHACLSGDYGQTEVFGETWVLQQNKGALVFWGSSTYTYWGEDDALERAMFDTLFEDTSPHADMTVMTYGGLEGMEAYNPSMARYYWETYNILGDPSVHLFMEPDLPTFTLDLTPTSQAVCTTGTLTSTVTIGSILNYSSTVYLENSELPFHVAASFDPAQAQAPYTSMMTVDVTEGASEGDHSIVITATDQVNLTLSTDLNLRINTSIPSVPVQLTPQDGAVDQPFTPTFDWEGLDLVRSYNFELGVSPLFEEPLVSTNNLTEPEHTLATPLEGGRCYWWHTQADNACGTGEWADPFHFSSVALGVSFYDDLESGAGQWTHQATQGTDHWAISTDQAYSPSHAWYVPDDGITTDTRLWNTTPVSVSAGSTLTFWQRYAFEGTNYDGSVLEISTNGGITWTDLGPHITANGYNGTIASGYSNPLAGRGGWTGDLTTWTQVSVDLSSFTGQAVQVRWRLGCDSSVSDSGWYIDDVQITSPLPPNPAPILDTITPNTGSNLVSTPIVITGSGFIASPALKLGDAWLETVNVVDTHTINAIVPAGIPAGVYDLTIYNGDCQTDVLEAAFTVTSEDESITGLMATSDSPTELGFVTTLTATIETGTNVTYEWDFGDGMTGTGNVVAHEYASEGIFLATVTATNSQGSQVATTEVEIFVLPVTYYLYLPVTAK